MEFKALDLETGIEYEYIGKEPQVIRGINFNFVPNKNVADVEFKDSGYWMPRRITPLLGY